jgi:DNA repair exonuclease SbcCD ATPase subunit
VKSKEEEIDDLQISLANAKKEIVRQADEFTLTQGSSTVAELDDLKKDLEERNEEGRELKAQLDRLGGYSRGLDELRSSYLKRSEEADAAKRELEESRERAAVAESAGTGLSSIATRGWCK